MFTSSDFQKLLQNHGINNILFMHPVQTLNTMLGISYTSSDDPEFILPATIDTKRYDPFDNYKVTLKCTLEGFAPQHYYISDLCALIDRGIVSIYVNQHKVEK